MIERWRRCAKKTDPDLSKIPANDRKVIEDLAANTMLVLHTLLSECHANLKNEREYATLLLMKYYKERKTPSDLTSHYKDLAWVVISSYSNDLTIKEMFDIFSESENVEKYLKTVKKEFLITPDNIFLNKVNLFASKYDRLDQMNSLLPFHPVKRGFADACPVTDEDYQLYAEVLAQSDPIFESVIYSIMHLKVPMKKSNE